MIALAALLVTVLILLSIPVAATLAIVGLTLSELYAFFPLTDALGDVAWSASTQFLLVAIPLFIMMGELLLRSGVTDEMYRALDQWLRRVPGGLMHTNIAACAMFSATSGSSVATTATVGTISVPNIARYGYNPRLFLGSVAAGGTLGILIPPSINMILYGVLADASVTALYLAALIPGLVLASLFALVVLLACLARPDWSGERRETPPLGVRLKGLVGLLTPIGLFLLVVGSIYAGLATPTEAASLGVLGALAATAWRGALSIRVLLEVFHGTMRTTCMVMLIVLAAYFLNFVISNIGLTDALVSLVHGLGWEPIHVLLAIIVVYFLMGCFMETISMMIATTPIVVPIVVALGYDPIWFGVLFMILIEAALITPPIGVNLFVVQSVRRGGSFRDVVVGAFPFLLMMMVMIGLLIVFPSLALMLPELVRG